MRIVRQPRVRQALRWTLVALGVGFVAIQFVPYGHAHTNPPVRREPAWDSPQTRELAARACFDCHSNQTSYRWYTYVAPISWYIQHDIDDGRRRLNFSEWDLPQREARSAATEVQRHQMPPAEYIPVHPEASLTDAERRALIDGLRATMASSPPPPSQNGPGGQRQRPGG
jgi:mono/diheme cytochrome c family protein